MSAVIRAGKSIGVVNAICQRLRLNSSQYQRLTDTPIHRLREILLSSCEPLKNIEILLRLMNNCGTTSQSLGPRDQGTLADIGEGEELVQWIEQHQQVWSHHQLLQMITAVCGKLILTDTSLKSYVRTVCLYKCAP